MARAALKLNLDILQARNLKDTQSLGTQDPYCRVKLGSKQQKTKTHEDGGKTAVWNRRLIFNYSGEQKCIVEVMNHNTLSDNLIGSVELPLAALQNPGAQADQWFMLYDAKRRKAGEIKIKLFISGFPQQAGSAAGQLGKQILSGQLQQQQQQSGAAAAAQMMQQQQRMQQQQMQQQQAQMQRQAQMQAQQAAQQQAMLAQQQAAMARQPQMYGGYQQQQNMYMQNPAAYGQPQQMYGQPQQMGYAAPQQVAPQPMKVEVTIPHGVVGGQQIQINIPGKGASIITVPQGMAAGQKFYVQC